MRMRMKWNKRINDVKNKTKIDLEFCFLNDVGYDSFFTNKFEFDTHPRKIWFNKDEKKVFRDADRYSVIQYRYYEIFLNKILPDGTKTKFMMRKGRNGLELYCMDNKDLTLSCDYIGPLKREYYFYKKSDSKELAKMLSNTRNFAGSIVWPNVKKTNFTVNQAKGVFLKDRMDLLLLNLKSFYDSNYNGNACDCAKLGQAFEDYAEWYKHFISFDKFVDYFCLNDFVNDRYEVIYYNSMKAYLDNIENLITNRKICIQRHM